eukprot:COSAG02_NODE_157_length_32999_cov_31.863647_20_plen_37_part_00
MHFTILALALLLASAPQAHGLTFRLQTLLVLLALFP